MNGVLHVGDCIDQMRNIPTGSVHTCVTSPPYYGLRDYGTAAWDGGDPDCDHALRKCRNDAERVNTGTFHGGKTFGEGAGVLQFTGKCHKCGATRTDNQIGQEKTPEEYITRMVEVFREVKRVLRDDGTIWVNIGDSYAGSGSSLKPKDLIGIPWMLAFALRADGWYLRQDIIWHKPNPMPESVTDRCTKSHEYIFLLAKSQRYYYDAEAIKEESEYQPGGSHSDVPQGGFADKGIIPGSGQRSFRAIRATRNKRDVWTISTKPCSEAHFAVFPEDLIEPCIKAGSPVGGIVLDPFMGSGTTGMVCERLKRKWVGCELNPQYAEMATRRIQAVAESIDVRQISMEVYG